MQTRIISAFPGTGKTYYHKLHPETTLDSDSSSFSWSYRIDGSKYRNPEFPQNYIDHIKSNIGKYEFIFVSSHAEVRKALHENCLYFYLIFPESDRKAEFLQRYIDRNSPTEFVNLLDRMWDEWIYSCRCDNLRSVNYSISAPSNLSEALSDLIEYEEDYDHETP
jgi:hypothetical protein